MMDSKSLSILLTLALAGVAFGEELALPATADLDPASTLVLELERAVVNVEVDAEAAPSLRARKVSEEAPSAAIVVEDSGRRVLVRRRLTDPADRPIRLELVVRPEQAIEIVGRELELTVSAPPPAGEEADVPSAGEAEESVPTSEEDLESQFRGLAWHYQVQLASSTADLSGLSGLRLETESSDVRVRDTAGALVASLDGGSLASEDHQGGLRLSGTGARIDVARHGGALLFELAGSELAVLTGEGTYRGEAEGGGVSLVDWSGRAVLAGQGARIEVRDGRDAAEVALSGRGLDAAVTRLDGKLVGDLDGGRLTGSTLAGNLELNARNEARISFSELRGETAALTLGTRASVDLLDVDSALEADVSGGARLAVDGVRQLGVKVVDGEIVADHVDAVELISVKNSRFDLDLTSLRRHPTMAQRGTSEGRLKLAQPCVVRLAGPVDIIDERVVVTGCDLVTLASRKEERMRGQRGYPEGTIVLVTNVEKDSGHLEIDGVVVP